MTLGLAPESRVLCAVSGGADSSALLHMCVLLWRSGGLAALGAAHFHHGLRPAADGDETFVRALCGGYGIPCAVGRGDAKAAARERGMGIEEAGRALRYDFLLGAARESGYDTLLTAHNANDNLETMLLNLTRGTGPEGLRGIPQRRETGGVTVLRPLLSVTREEILKYALAHKLSYREDESNSDPAFRRNLLRREVLPVLRGINPNAEAAAGRAASLLAGDEEFLSGLAGQELASRREGDGSFPVSRLLELHPSLSSRVLREMCRAAGLAAPNSAHINALLALCASKSPHAAADLPGNLRARRVYGALIVGKAQPSGLPSGISVNVGEAQPGVVNNSFNTFYVCGDTIRGAVRVRSRQSGDKAAFPGRGGTKTLKKLFIDEKIPLERRGAIPVVADDAGVIAVSGFGVDRARAPREGKRTVCIQLTMNN
ncbi:MAG: tRNA lysidine(34) synthetase TilS [Oscillospiraceae bacterium]|nr:tRNA lysidine(34) synthetase TilS [Oscillospiraceae bacterium]